MVLMSSTAFDAWPTLLTREIQRTPPDQRVELFVHSGIRASLRVGMADPDRITPEQVMQYLRPWTGPGNVEAFFRFADAMDGTGLADREADLGTLEIPVLIFWGEEDEFYPPAIAERLNAAIPTSTLGLLPGCRHFLVEDAIETIGPMIYEYLRARYLHEPHGGHGDGSGIVSIQLERSHHGSTWPDTRKMHGTTSRRRGRIDHREVVPVRDQSHREPRSPSGGEGHPQDFVVDLDIEVNVGDDDIGGTADYRGITDDVRAIVEERSFDLIESMAAAIADEILRLERVARVTAVVHKPNAALRLGIDGVAAAATAPNR